MNSLITIIFLLPILTLLISVSAGIVLYLLLRNKRRGHGKRIKSRPKAEQR